MSNASIVGRTLDDLLDDELSQVIGSSGDLTNPAVFIDDELPVDVIQFIEDHKYLGGQVKLQNEVKDLLWDIEDPEIREVDLELGKGSGKSEISSITQLYGAYVVTRLRFPHKFFGLSDSTLIAAVNVSIGREQAKDIVFQSVKGKVETSPYFQSLGPSVLTKEILLPRNLRIFCGHSGDKAWLGYATIRGVMDEVNYMFDNQNRNVAKQLYDALMGSMTTRFPKSYKLVSVSSVTLPSTWLHTRITKAEAEGAEYVRRIQGMKIKVTQQFPDGRQLIAIQHSDSSSEEEVKRTLAVDHGRRLLSFTPGKVLEGTNIKESTAEVTVGELIEGL